MRKIVWFLVVPFWLFATEFTSSKNCLNCHTHIVQDWQNSWHAKSHIDKNEYYQKALAYTAKKRYKSQESIAIECATCHNPRIEVTQVTQAQELKYAISGQKSEKIVNAVKADIIKEGINCIVCHKIDTIKHTTKDAQIGNSKLTWLKEGVIGGPFDDSKAAYHKSKQQSFFNDPDKLCLVCHESLKSSEDVTIANTGQEFKANKKDKQCVDCHMGPKQEGYASLVANSEGKKVRRMVRRHLFKGAHDEGMIKQALELQVVHNNGTLEVHMHNPNPHSVPTGYSSREIVIDITYQTPTKQLKQTKSLTQYYTSKRGRNTIGHLAKSVKGDAPIKAYETKTLTFHTPQGAQKATVTLWYKLANDHVVKLLDLQEEQWSKKTKITTQTIAW